jgi:hypothetical protein
VNAAWILLCVLAAGAALWALHRANARDRTALAARLGLAEVARGAAERGVHPVMGPFVETPLMRGTLDGLDARVVQRTVRRYGLRNPRARSGFTVLRLRVPGTAPVLRVEPRRTGEMLASLCDGESEVATGDEAFDAAWLATSPRPDEARAFLSPDVRSALLALRASRTHGLPATALGRFSGDLLVGTFEIGDGRLDYAAMGTPTPGMAEHLVAALPCAVALARRAATARPPSRGPR